MVRMKMRLCLPKWKKASVGTMPIAVHGLQRKEVRETYEQELGKHLSECPYVASKTVEDNWSTVKECIIQTSEKVLGRGRQKQPVMTYNHYWNKRMLHTEGFYRVAHH